MDFNVRFREGALEDLKKAYFWYENRKNGLGADFLSEIESGLKYLRVNPEAFPEKKKGFRELALKTFPYLIIYMIKDRLVTVFAIFHSHLNPNKKPSA